MSYSPECLVCGATSWKGIYSNTLLSCNNCGFITANMEVSEEQLQAIYTENYFKGEEYLDYLTDERIQKQNFRSRLRELFKQVPQEKPLNALEIGCAYGLFGQVLKEDLPQANYVGFDVVPEAIYYAQETLKLDARNEDYLTSKSGTKYDATFMWDVIEHLPEPEKFIEKIASESRDGSVLCITTGDIGALLPRLQKQKWRLIHPPSHLHYFSAETLSRLVEKYGFELKSVSHPSVKRSFRLTYYSLFMLNRKYPKWVEKIYNKIPLDYGFSINTFDIVYLIAQKT